MNLLTELLGQALERRLHDAGLDAHVAPIRRLVLDATGQAGLPANAIVDGYVVARGWLGPDQVVPLTGTEQDVRDALLDYAPVGGDLRVALDRHAQDLDGVADTALAQAVHALVRGNPEAASAAVDGISGGEAGPAALTSLRSGRGGRRITHRVLLLLDATVESGDRCSGRDR